VLSKFTRANVINLCEKHGVEYSGTLMAMKEKFMDLAKDAREAREVSNLIHVLGLGLSLSLSLRSRLDMD
jgi:hypothetical protein